MSDIAVAWAKAQACPDRNAKQVLVHLASYADAQGEAWAMVPLLALEMEVVDRTVQRGLRTLEGVGLLKRTGRSKTHRGRVMPIYQLPLDQGHANTKRRMSADAWGDASVTPRPAGKAGGRARGGHGAATASGRDAMPERASSANREGVDSGRPGDAGVTPDGCDGVTVVSPQDVADVTPRGDTGVTQIGKGISQGLKPSAGACAKAQRLWAGKAPERVSPVRVEASWADAIGRRAVDDEALLGAVSAAVKADPDFRRGKAMNLDRWLDEDRFLVWLDVAETQPGPAAWDGPPEVAAAVSAVMGPEQRASYFEPARWDGERRAVVGRTRFAADRLKRDAGAALSAIGVSVECDARG